MTIVLRDEIAEAVNVAAQTHGMSADDFVNGLIVNQLDNSIAVLQMNRVEDILANEILPRLMNVQMNTFALRHQATNFHADILDTPERATIVAQEANDIAYDLVFGEEK